MEGAFVIGLEGYIIEGYIIKKLSTYINNILKTC